MCNKCFDGVYEIVGCYKVDPNEGLTNFIPTRHVEDKAAIIMQICSREECGDVNLIAGPEVLPTLKKMARENDFGKMQTHSFT